MKQAITPIAAWARIARVGVLAAITASTLSLAQAPDSVAQERARIATERQAAEARFASEEKACNVKFAVTDCVNEARARRREVLADLRRQDISINDAERKRRSSERIKTIEERSSPQAQQQAAEQRATARSEQAAREQAFAQKAADRARQQQERAARAAADPPGEARGKVGKAAAATSDGAANLQRSQARQQAAKERRDKLQKRLADRNKAASPPLPVPP